MGNALKQQFPNGFFVSAESEAAIALQSEKLIKMDIVYAPVHHSPPNVGFGPGCQALGGVFMGALYTVTNQPEIFSNNVGVVINCTHDLSAYPAYHTATRRMKEKLGITFARLVWADSDVQKLEAGDIKGAVGFIHETRAKGISVLVHCVMGVSRSATLVVAYMVATTKMSVDECLAELRGKRESTNPNDGFISQLKEMEAELKAMELAPLSAQQKK